MPLYRDLLTLLPIALLLMTSALFSAAEISFLALSRRRAHRGAGGRTAAAIERLLSHPAATLGAMLVTITALNYTAEAVAASWVISRQLPLWWAIVGMALLVMIFAEIVPISYAAANAPRVARVTALPVTAAFALLSIPARAIGFVADRLARLLGARLTPEAPVTEGEIRAIVDLQAEAGSLEEEEKVMIHQIFEFGDKVAREVMVPRTDMASIAVGATVSQAAEAATRHRISRLPVYRDTLDHIVGVVHVKDLLPLLASGKGDAPITDVLRQPLRVPETKKLSDLLTELLRRRRSLALVLDEYGGTAGLVTLEDLLEEVVGDIYDEYDVVRPAVESVGADAIALEGRMSIEEASEAIGIPLPEGDYDSVAGLLYSRLGIVPKPGRRLRLEGVTLVVGSVEGHRITRVLALREPQPDE